MVLADGSRRSARAGVRPLEHDGNAPSRRSGRAALPRATVRAVVGREAGRRLGRADIGRGTRPSAPHLPQFRGARLPDGVRAGVSIAGTVFQIVGEPITDACISTIRSAGATAIPLYGSMETASIGYGCLDPVHSDDIHLLDDMLGLIQAGAAGPAAGLPEKAIFVTCLHPRSPFLLLNASMGDAAELSDRACGCGLQQAGWRRHLHNIRSFEKLNAHGVTFLAAEILPVLERILPSRLGGAPTNYQLVETESADGQPRVELRVDPAVGEIPDETIMDELCAALEGVSRPAAQRIRLWRDAGTLAIVRRPPLASRAGKILHVHRQWGRS